ncbi:MAG: prepilin-type N-terminal cleavage/methylation domain-containing protein [Candidatus Aureabacteria bacterium]|nr:prepilin-type N-terminal cleavage/methylation domain-containing protein [Candidatus Auribacterota bacterium]
MRKIKGFTLVEIMIVVAILGLLIAIGVPGFLTARNRSRNRTEGANLKAITDNICSYGINNRQPLDDIIRLWPTVSTISDPESYIRKQLLCPINKTAYQIDSVTNLGSCTTHGMDSTIIATLGGD